MKDRQWIMADGLIHDCVLSIRRSYVCLPITNVQDNIILSNLFQVSF